MAIIHIGAYVGKVKVQHQAYFIPLPCLYILGFPATQESCVCMSKPSWIFHGFLSITYTYVCRKLSLHHHHHHHQFFFLVVTIQVESVKRIGAFGKDWVEENWRKLSLSLVSLSSGWDSFAQRISPYIFLSTFHLWAHNNSTYKRAHTRIQKNIMKE